MFEKLKEIEIKFEGISGRLLDGGLGQDERRSLMKEYAELEPIVEAYREHKAATLDLEESRELLGESNMDEDFRQMVKQEYKDSQERIEEVSGRLKILLLPKDPNDDKNVIVEIRGGAGGDEAALFAGDLFRMYSRFAERSGWRTELLSTSDSDVGGFKEAVFLINGRGAYSRLKYESGVHRVQRIPVTESGGRIHTSTVTVAVLPEAEEVDVDLNMDDIRVDVFRSSGNGGQSVNTTDSAVRITHMPSGIVVSCQDEKSQHKNKDKAIKILRAKLYDLELEKKQKEERQARNSQIGTGDRSERIRTYNFPQGRVTDHRVSLTLHRLEAVLDGDLEEITDTLITSDQAAKLQAGA